MKVLQKTSVKNFDKLSVDRVDDKVTRIVVPQPFYEPNNVYLIEGDEPILIDSGYFESVPVLQAGLRRVGLSLSSIRHIIYTHPHIDHISAAMALRKYTRAKMYGLKGLAFSVGDYLDYTRRFADAGHAVIRRAYKDPDDAEQRIERSKENWARFFKKVDEESAKFRRTVDNRLIIDEEIDFTDQKSIGGYDFKFIHTPGHCNTHISPILPSSKILFSGDLIIGNLTAIYSDLDGNLTDYYETLDKLEVAEYERMLPAHGDEIEGPRRRIKLVRKTLKILERGILRRLRESAAPLDLKELLVAAMGDKVLEGNHTVTALALMDSIARKLCRDGTIAAHLNPRGYATYLYIGD